MTENSIQYSKIEGLCSKVNTVLYSTVQELETIVRETHVQPVACPPAPSDLIGRGDYYTTLV